jgi:hypothetical protein
MIALPKEWVRACGREIASSDDEHDLSVICGQLNWLKDLAQRRHSVLVYRRLRNEHPPVGMLQVPGVPVNRPEASGASEGNDLPPVGPL